MTSQELEIIEQIKVAEQKGNDMIQKVEEEARTIIEKQESNRIKKLEQARHEARELLKQQLEEAKNTENYLIMIKEAEKQVAFLKKTTQTKMEEVAENIANLIVNANEEW